MSSRSDEMPAADAGQLDPGVGRLEPERKDDQMLTMMLCRISHCRLRPAWARNAAGWQAHWLWFYFEWRSEQ
jgi:hypothetical protein